MRSTKNLLLVVGALLFIVGCKQKIVVELPVTIAFYNVENLFDTINAPVKFDDEFTPAEPKEWNTERYYKKLSSLSKVLASIDTAQLPVMIGLCEVENDVVLNDLVGQKDLSTGNYSIIWDDGPDFRGIDCALLYNSNAFELTNSEMLKVASPEDPDFITRDILYAKGLLLNEEFHVFVCHWPSRRGGAEVSEPKRVLAANVLRKKIDEIQSITPDANIIIMGDMNDEPGNLSISDVLMASPNNMKPKNDQLVNLMYDEYEEDKGSYSYRGKWDMIDNIIVSGALINKTKGLKSKLDNGFIFHQPFMEYVNEQGQMSPNRTYGRSYYGGISDHFPVYMVLE